VPTTERISIEQAYRKALHTTCNFYQNVRGHCGAPKGVEATSSIWNDHPPRLRLQTQRNGRTSTRAQLAQFGLHPGHRFS